MINLLLFWGDKLHWISNVKSACMGFSILGKQSGNDFLMFRWQTVISLYVCSLYTQQCKKYT